MSARPLAAINPNAPRLSMAGPSRSVKGQSARRMSTAPTQRRQTMAHPGEAPTTQKNRRKSSVRGGTSSGRRQDPRDISSKKYQNQCKKRIIEYLSVRGFHGPPVTVKTLTSPNQQDFLSIMDFLWKQIDPMHSWSAKPHEEIPKLFQQLKYPVSLNKSNFISVGVPHVWPNILAAMRWLVDLLVYMERVEEDRRNNAHEDDEISRMFFEYLAKSYRMFLAGDDTYEKDNDLARKFQERDAAEEEEVAVLEKENDALRKEIEAMRLAPDRVEELEKKKKVYQQDVAKFSHYIQTLESYEKELNEAAKNKNYELESRKKDIEHFRVEKDDLEEKVSAQELSAIDVDRMNMDKKRLEEELDQLGRQKQQVHDKIWDGEMKVARKVEEVEEVARKCNDLSSDLKLIPSTAKYAEGQNYEIRLHIHGTTPQEILGVDLKKMTKPQVAKLKDLFTNKFYNSHEENLTLKADLTRLEDAVAEREDNNRQEQGKLDRAQKQHLKEREDQNEKIKQIHADTENLNDEAKVLHDKWVAELDRSVSALEKVKKAYEELDRSCNAESQKYGAMLLQTLEVLTQHKEHVHRNLVDLQNYVERESKKLAESSH
mmetsp:Transcript_30847/g.86457  ORF Transcript_30847/g.86457 Transcript_30847/m.86457 type:complete len:600 (-) Transcript_30847:66-1865(-)